WTRLAGGGVASRSGLVREAACLGSDGSLARYRLCLVPWTWLLGQGRHSRVYQDRTVLQIVESVFAGYGALAAWQCAAEVGPFLARVRPRSYCVQYRETDLAFVSRLLAEEGLGWRLEECDEAPGGHRLVLFAGSGEGPQEASAAAWGGIRFHRSDATERTDTVQAFGAVRRLEASSLTLLSHDYKRMQAHGASVPLDGSEVGARLESYDPVGPYAFADRSEAERYAGLLAQAREAQREVWLGRGTVRTFRAGTWFALHDAPSDGEQPPEEALLTTVRHAGVNDLPRAVREAIAAVLGEAPAPEEAGGSATLWDAVRAQAERVGYANAFTAVPRARPWRPVLEDGTGARLNPRPTAPGYQTAIVVGPDGHTRAQGAQELYCDALGRIRVRFHFQQPGEGAEAADSCWLRVAQRYAGPGVGAQFLPRIGQEVLVGFLEGDIDRPVVVGALYNGQGEAGVAATPGGAPAGHDLSAYAQAGDHRASAQANLRGGHAPAWHGMSPDGEGHRNAAALLGLQSKEFGGSGHNRLVFDDSDGQLRLQLATTHQASQLTLGHLIHQADNHRGSFRGEGFELRTDGWGAVRGERGLWVSAYAAAGEAPAGDHVAAGALLQQARQLGEALSQAAATHRTVKLAAHEGVHGDRRSRLRDGQAPLQALLTSAKTTVDGRAFEAALGEAGERRSEPGEGRVPHTGDPLLGLAAPAGIGLVAGQSLHWSVGETLTLASGQASNAAIAGDLRLHSGQAIGVLANAVEAKSAAAADRSEAASAGEAAALSLVAA
ncbi:type VI secretion system Vgr family protein, partial [Vulcaniibacterium tengchongense]